MKKLIFASLLVVFMMFGALQSPFIPQKPTVDALELTFDAATWAQVIKQLVELEKLYSNAMEILNADTLGILGEYGLGSLSPVMDQFLKGSGLQEILTDSVGGSIGAGGFLQGALSGVFSTEDTVSVLLKQFGLDMSSGLYDQLKDSGYLNLDGVLGGIVGGGDKKGGSCSFGDVAEDVFSYDSMRQVLLGKGLDLSVGQIQTQVKNCLLNPKELQKDVVPTSTIMPDPPIAEVNSCELENGVCKSYRTSFGDSKCTNPLCVIKTKFEDIVPGLIQLFLSLAGGIALLIIIISGYKILMSSGKPEAVQSAKEQLTAAIIGLLFIFFSFGIFQLAVVDILKIPGVCKNANDKNCIKQNWNIPNRSSFEDKGKDDGKKVDKCTEDCNANNRTIESCAQGLNSSDCSSDSRGFSVCWDELVKNTCGVKKDCSKECYSTGGGF